MSNTPSPGRTFSQSDDMVFGAGLIILAVHIAFFNGVLFGDIPASASLLLTILQFAGMAWAADLMRDPVTGQMPARQLSGAVVLLVALLLAYVLTEIDVAAVLIVAGTFVVAALEIQAVRMLLGR